MLALDSQGSREDANRELLAGLEPLDDSFAGCLVWTKCDLISAGVAATSASFRLPKRVEGWPSFRSRFDEEASLYAPFDFMLRGATIKRGHET
jgi:hypothetical protein